MEQESKTSKEYITNFLETARNQNMTYQNFRKPHDDVMNKYEMIEAQIDNLNEDYNRISKKHAKYMDNKEIKNLITSDKIVPVDVYEMLAEKESIMSQMADWKILQCELVKIDDEKLANAIGAVRGMDIEKEVLTNMKEVIKQRDDMIVEIVNEKMKVVDEKQEAFKQMMADRFDGFAVRLHSMFMNNIREMFNKIVAGNPNITINRQLEAQDAHPITENYEKECAEKDSAYRKKVAMDIITKQMEESERKRKEKEKSMPTSPSSEKSDSVDVSNIRREGGKYICPHCPEKFDNVKMLNSHLKFMHQENGG